MDDIEFAGSARQVFQHDDVRREIVADTGVEPQRTWPHRFEVRFGDAVARGEKRNVVA
jgi:hypothetical protein